MEAGRLKLLLKMTINDKDHLQHTAGDRGPASVLARLRTKRPPIQIGHPDSLQGPGRWLRCWHGGLMLISKKPGSR